MEKLIVCKNNDNEVLSRKKKKIAQKTEKTEMGDAEKQTDNAGCRK